MDSKLAQGKWNRVRTYLAIGITVLVATGILTFSKDRIVVMFNSAGSGLSPENYLQLMLLITTLFLIYQWIRIHIGEVDLLNDNLENFIPPLPRPSFALIISFAIILGLLGYFSYNILLYSSFFVVFSIFDIWSIYYRNLTLRKALKNARSAISDPKQITYLQAIEDYYIGRPHMQRSATVMFFSFIALICGILSKLYQSPSFGELFGSFAYGTMSVNIIVSEIIINHWRKVRDGVLEENYS